MGAAGWTQGGSLRILFDFGVILGPVSISFLCSEARNLIFLRACFQVIFLSISLSKFRRLGLPNRGVRKESIAKDDLSWKSFLMNSRVDFGSFWKALGPVFLVIWALKTDLNIDGFLVM